MKLILSSLLLLQLSFAFGQSKNMHEAGKPIFIISNDLAQYTINHIQFNAELIGKKRRFGFNCYYNKGMSDPLNDATYNRKEVTMSHAKNGEDFYKEFYMGVDAKFYPPVETKKFRYFYSVGFEGGETSSKIEDQSTMINRPGYWQGNTYYYYSLSTSTTNSDRYSYGLFLGFHHKQGCLWTITKWLYLEAEINVGLNHFSGADSKSNTVKYGAGLHLGFAI